MSDIDELLKTRLAELGNETETTKETVKTTEKVETTEQVETTDKTEKVETTTETVQSKKLYEIIGVDDYKEKEDDYIINDIKETKQKNKELEQNYLKSQDLLKSVESPFASEMEHKAYLLKKAYPSISYDTASKLVNAEEVAKLDDYEALILSSIISDPDTNAAVELKLLKREFEMKPLTEDEKAEMSPEELEKYNEDAEIKKALLLKKSKVAKKELAEMAGKIETPKILTAEDRKKMSDERNSKLSENWNKVGDAYSKEFKKFDIPMEVKEGEIETVGSIEIPDAVKKQIMDYVVQTMVSGNYAKFDEAEGKQFHAYVQNAVVLNSLPKITKSAYDKGYEAAMAEKNNAGIPGDKNKKVVPEQNDKGDIKQVQDEIRKKFNI